MRSVELTKNETALLNAMLPLVNIHATTSIQQIAGLVRAQTKNNFIKKHATELIKEANALHNTIASAIQTQGQNIPSLERMHFILITFKQLRSLLYCYDGSPLNKRTIQTSLTHYLNLFNIFSRAENIMKNNKKYLTPARYAILSNAITNAKAARTFRNALNILLSALRLPLDIDLSLFDKHDNFLQDRIRIHANTYTFSAHFTHSSPNMEVNIKANLLKKIKFIMIHHAAWLNGNVDRRDAGIQKTLALLQTETNSNSPQIISQLVDLCDEQIRACPIRRRTLFSNPSLKNIYVDLYKLCKQINDSLTESELAECNSSCDELISRLFSPLHTIAPLKMKMGSL